MQTEHQRRLLGAFLRARREALPPDTAGGRRRTPGLRREELAARAGIGVTWCAWLEQGREVRASSETLARLADALVLTRPERAYLFELADRRDPRNPFADTVSDAPECIAALVRALPHPAYGLDPAWNVCCSNAAAAGLFVGLLDGGGHRNLLRYVFTEPAARQIIPDWQQRALRILAEFRADYGRNPADPRTHAVVEWLAGESAFFRDAWSAQAVLAREGGLRIFQPQGSARLCFTQHTLSPADRPDFKLVVLEPVACPDS